MRVLITFIGLMFSAFALLGQTIPLPPAGIKYQENFNVQELTYFRMPEGALLENASPIDLQLTIHKTVEKAVEKRIMDSGDFSSTITILHPGEAFKEWPDQVGRIEIDQNGILIYRPDQTLYHSMSANAEDLAAYATLKDGYISAAPPIITVFPMPGSAVLQAIQSTEVTVTQLPNNAVMISDAQHQTKYEPQRLRVTESAFEAGALKEKYIKQYVLTEQGVLTPQFERTETKVTRPSGACMERIVMKRYANYHIVAASGGERGMSVETDFSIVPNPASARISVSMGQSVLPGSTCTISDVMGAVVYQKTAVQPDETFDLDIISYPKGLYFIQVETQSGVQIAKFIKD